LAETRRSIIEPMWFNEIKANSLEYLSTGGLKKSLSNNVS